MVIVPSSQINLRFVKMVASHLRRLASLMAFLFALVSIVEARALKRVGLPKIPRHYGSGLSSYNVPLSDGRHRLSPCKMLRARLLQSKLRELLSSFHGLCLDDSHTNLILYLGTQSLPAPNGTLKFITIGRGTQNYTCNSTTPSPVLVGANAVLLDASPLLPLLPPDAGVSVLDILPRYVIDLDFAAIEVSQIPKLGKHYFDSKGVPTFDLGSNGLLKGKGLAGIPAPADASAGPFDQGYGAVDWKTLTDAGSSVGLKEVYRVETAGGKAPPSCTGVTAPIYIDYSALYWFYN